MAWLRTSCDDRRARCALPARQLGVSPAAAQAGYLAQALDLFPRARTPPPRCSRCAAERRPSRRETSGASIPRAAWRARSSAGWSPDDAAGALGLELALDSMLTGAPGRGGAPQGPRRPAVRLAVAAGPRAGAGERRVSHARRGAAGDRRARRWRTRSSRDEGRGGRRRLSRPEHRRAAGAGIAAARGGAVPRAVHVHRSLRAGLHRQAVHGGGAAPAQPRWTPTTRCSARVASGTCRYSRAAGHAGSPTTHKATGNLTLAEAIRSRATSPWPSSPAACARGAVR